MELHFLGTGAGMPSKERNTSAIAMKLLDERGTVWLFDCGEATQHQILHTSIKPRKIEKIFITHLHGDHVFGLPGLLSSRSFLGGEDTLTIYGPTGLKSWIEATLALTGTHLTYPIDYVEAAEGIVFEDEQFIVRAMPLAHVITCYGYRIEQKPLLGELLVEKALALGVPKGPLLGKLKQGHDVVLETGETIYSANVTAPVKEGFVVTILGDTKLCDNAVRLAEGADVVVHEATFDAETAHLAASYGHATNVEAATVAKEAHAKNLILNHISARFLPNDIAKLLQQARAVFPSTYIANDYAQFELRNQEFKHLE
ncbi:ribonuclease Z [Metasolibacillus meyeri]|uniref:Ribonuclease Z n=1 Tax=Metasolibacillus meyeri TaxID=1071052 RepID=A0AAW9NNU1_9BACL|nr:ribonuclease Z [Metasolibacillus meyeri]MEC1178191.1 ribonuclease Z [Metasolibacillus meyeri]